ncbi:MAG: phage portal protein, partial [Phycicoccus sp.]
EGPAGVAERVPTPAVIERPSLIEQAVATWSSMALDLIWHGNAVAIISARDELGTPLAISPVPAENVHVRLVTSRDGIPLPVGSLAYEVNPADTVRRWYPASDVLHIKGLSRPGALVGIGVLELHLSSLELAHEQRTQAGAASGAGVPTGVLRSENPDLTAAEAAALKASWKRSQQTRDVAVLNATTSFEAMAWNPTEAQLIEARQFSLVETALMFGLDPSWVGAAQTSRVYTNNETEGINLWRTSGLAGLLSRFEAGLSELVSPPRTPTGLWVRGNVDARLRPDTKTRYEAHQLGIAAGWLLRSEVRELEDLPPVQGIDDPPEPPASDVEDDTAFDEGPPAARSEADLWIYWTAGEGKARWATSPTPLRALYDQLARFLPAQRAAATALAWFADGMGRKPRQGDGEVPDLEEAA